MKTKLLLMWGMVLLIFGWGSQKLHAQDEFIVKSCDIESYSDTGKTASARLFVPDLRIFKSFSMTLRDENNKIINIPYFRTLIHPDWDRFLSKRDSDSLIIFSFFNNGPELKVKYFDVYGIKINGDTIHTQCLVTNHFVSNIKNRQNTDIKVSYDASDLNVSITNYNGNIDVRILDTNGKNILNKKLAIINGKGTLYLADTHLKQGLYIVNLLSDEISWDQKILIK